MHIQFYGFGEVDHQILKYAVIVARHDGKWIYVKHKERDTWEIPGGRRESGEAIADTAKRELFEETGAKVYNLTPLCAYSVQDDSGEKSFGGLFFSEVKELGELPESEIETIALFENTPERLTYPHIQPYLLEETLRILYR